MTIPLRALPAKWRDTLPDVLALLDKATPGEWAQEHRKRGDGLTDGYHTDVFDTDGVTIATLAWHAKPPRVEDDRRGTSTDRAENAAAIVAAVNWLREHGPALSALPAPRVDEAMRALDAACALIGDAQGDYHLWDKDYAHEVLGHLYEGRAALSPAPGGEGQ